MSKILDLVENASSRKSRSEAFITRFARVYTPAVCIAALALALLPPLVRMGAPGPGASVGGLICGPSPSWWPAVPAPWSSPFPVLFRRHRRGQQGRGCW